MTDHEEQHLWNELRAGRSEAYAQLVHAHYQAVYRFLVHLTRNVHEAEDLTQETFVTAWAKRASFRGGSSPATWLHRIAYTKYIDAQRCQQRTLKLRDRLPNASTTPPAVLDTVMADDEAQRLYRALHKLDITDQTVLVLHYLQGLSYREMAVVLEQPTGTVKWRTTEALRHLRALLCEKVPDHDP